MKAMYLAIFLTGCGVAHGGNQGNGMVCLTQGEYDEMLFKANRPEASKEEETAEPEAKSKASKTVGEAPEVEAVAVESSEAPKPAEVAVETVKVLVEEHVGLYTSMTKESYTVEVIKEDYLKRSQRFCATSVQTLDGYKCELHWGRSMINCVSVDANGFRCELAKMDKNFKVTNDLKDKENHQ